MCQKTNTIKRFFVVLNHPFPLQRSIPLGVVKQNPYVQQLYEITRTSLFLTEPQLKELGFQAPKASQAYLVPIEIPRDWFLH